MARGKRPTTLGAMARALGATQPVGTLHVVFFVPSANRFGESIAHDEWVGQALRVFGELFRGATAYPRARGVWRDDARGGELVFEQPTIIFTYADPAVLSMSVRARLRAFLQRMGRDTAQGEVGIVVNGHYFGITKFDGANGA